MPVSAAADQDGRRAGHPGGGDGAVPEGAGAHRGRAGRLQGRESGREGRVLDGHLRGRAGQTARPLLCPSPPADRPLLLCFFCFCCCCRCCCCRRDVSRGLFRCWLRCRPAGRTPCCSGSRATSACCRPASISSAEVTAARCRAPSAGRTDAAAAYRCCTTHIAACHRLRSTGPQYADPAPMLTGRALRRPPPCRLQRTCGGGRDLLPAPAGSIGRPGPHAGPPSALWRAAGEWSTPAAR